MELLVAFCVLEVVLCFVVSRKLRALRRLEKELRRTMFDLELAFTFAHQGRYQEAHAAARQWHDRLRAMRRGEPYRPPEPPPRTDTVASCVRFH